MKPLALLLLLASTASAQVVVGTNIRASADLYSHTVDDLPLWFWVTKQAQPSVGCLQVGCETFAGFDYQDGIISGDDMLLDEGSDWFVVQPGDVFSAATAGTFPHLLGSVSDFNHVVYDVPADVGSDFYLGVRTGYGIFIDYANLISIPDRSAYGWVHMRAEGGQLSMVGNAMAYGNTGIVVGTNRAVPEPGIIWSVVVGLLFGHWRKRHV